MKKEEIENLIKTYKESDAYGMWNAFNELKITSLEIPCPKCNGKLNRHHTFWSGPYGGFVSCESCKYKKGMCAFLGEMLVQVQPMLDGAKLIFEMDEEK